MATTVRRKTNQKQLIRFRRKKKIRAKIIASTDRPRLAVFRSNYHLYVQIIDDKVGRTLVAASTNEETTRGKMGKNIEGAKALGSLIAKRALAKQVQKIVFDRSGYVFHGRIRAIADGAREGGLQF